MSHLDKDKHKHKYKYIKYKAFSKYGFPNIYIFRSVSVKFGVEVWAEGDTAELFHQNLKQVVIHTARCFVLKICTSLDINAVSLWREERSFRRRCQVQNPS